MPQYGAAVLVVALAVAVRFALEPWVGESVTLITFFPAVALIAWFAGARAALFGAALGLLAANFFFMAPRYALTVAGLPPLPLVVAYSVACGSIILLAAAAHRRHDRSERYAAALREREAEYRALFELSAVGVAQADPVTGRFLHVNQRFCEITGYTGPELLELTFMEITHPDDREANRAVLEPILRGECERWDIEKRYVRSDGAPTWVHVSGQLVKNAQDEPFRVVANAVEITDRKKAEQALLASRRQLQLITDGAPVLLLNCARDYRFKFVNRPYAERLGLQPRDVVGRLPADVLGEEAFAGIKPYADRALQGERSEFVAQVDYRDIGTRWIQCAYAPEHDDSGEVVGWVAAVLDITERKEAEEALRESEQRFKHMANTAPAMLWIADSNHRCTFLSRSWYEYTGRTEAEGLGTRWIEAVHPDDRKRIEEASSRAAERGEPFSVDYRLRRADGEYRWAIAAGRPRLADGGEFRGYIGSVIDVHERKLAEDALREADRRKDEFLAMLAHELRNPLAAIRNAAEMVKLIQTGDRRLEAAQGVLDRQSAHMARLIDGLLDLSRISRGKITLQRHPLDLRSLLGRVLQQNDDALAKRRLELETNFPTEPCWVRADEVRLAQVFDNLIGNAIKFTEPPGRLAVSLQEEDGHARIRFQDTGIGIAPDMLTRVFEPFQQGTHESARAAGGLGLGLALAKDLVELHHGTIAAESEGPGHGARFEVRLPLLRAPPGEAHEAARDAPVPPQRVLIVEDSADPARMLRELLETRGHDVAVAEDGATALATVRERPPDIVLCDIGLPDVDGYELARAIRALTSPRRIGLVALTGYGRPEDRDRAAEAGFDEHLTKPADLHAIEEVFERLLRRAV